MDKIDFTYKQKLEIAKWLAEKNYGAVTGSIMLKERGIDIGREPNDIDIIVGSIYPDEVVLSPLCTNKTTSVDNGGYEVLTRCYFFGLKIEFITDANELRKSTYINREDNCKFASVDGLLKAKIEYLRHDKNEAYLDKTKHDIDIILTHIKNVVNK